MAWFSAWDGAKGVDSKQAVSGPLLFELVAVRSAQPECVHQRQLWRPPLQVQPGGHAGRGAAGAGRRRAAVRPSWPRTLVPAKAGGIDSSLVSKPAQSDEEWTNAATCSLPLSLSRMTSSDHQFPEGVPSPQRGQLDVGLGFQTTKAERCSLVHDSCALCTWNQTRLARAGSPSRQGSRTGWCAATCCTTATPARCPRSTPRPASARMRSPMATPGLLTPRCPLSSMPLPRPPAAACPCSGRPQTQSNVSSRYIASIRHHMHLSVDLRPSHHASHLADNMGATLVLLPRREERCAHGISVAGLMCPLARA